VVYRFIHIHLFQAAQERRKYLLSGDTTPVMTNTVQPRMVRVQKHTDRYPGSAHQNSTNNY